MPDLRDPIQSALAAFAGLPLRTAALALLNTLGYSSDRTHLLEGSSPQVFLDFISANAAGSRFDAAKALLPEWKSADILFQLTDAEIVREDTLFP